MQRQLKALISLLNSQQLVVTVAPKWLLQGCLKIGTQEGTAKRLGLLSGEGGDREYSSSEC